MANEAKFSIRLDGNVVDVADQSADSLVGLTKEVEKNEASIKTLSATMRQIKGDSDDAKAARKSLKAQIDAERGAITKNSLALAKQGVTTNHVKDAQKKAGEESKKMKEANQASALAIRDAGEKAAGAGLAIGGAFVVGVVAATVSLGKYILAGANAARTADLLREAATGSAANAKAYGSQIDDLAKRVSASRESLNALGVSLAKSGLQGKVLVDTLNATATANDALGDDAGAKLRSIVEAGRLSKRLGPINPLESLVGTGIDFNELAGSVAKGMKVTVQEAKAALVEGRVPLAAGAEALRVAVDQRLGKISAKKVLDVNVQAEKFGEKLSKLTEGVNLEPFLVSLSKILGIFEDTSAGGATLKDVVTSIGNKAVTAFTIAAPYIAQFTKGLVIGALKIEKVATAVYAQFAKAFGSDTTAKVDGMALALKAGAAAAEVVGGAIIFVAGAVASTIYTVTSLIGAFQKFTAGITSAVALVKAQASEWEAAGASLIDGLVDGIKNSVTKVKAAVTSLGTEAKNTFKSVMRIQSPSKVFAEYGRNTAEGYAIGVEDGSPQAAIAVQAMAPGAPKGAGGSSGGGAVTVNVTINAGSADASAMQSPAFLSGIVKAIEDALISSGVVPA